MGRYEVLVPIASGGMGMVYLARSRGVGGFEREVALKLLHPHVGQRDRLTQDLIEEAKLTGLIRHPNVVQVYDVDEDALGVFMAMEYVEGCSLADLMEDATRQGYRLSLEVGLRILIDALAGLHAAHELLGKDGRPLQLVHRDFSPHNILVGIDGTTKLADFGIAKAHGRAGHTATGAIKGKLGYLAPEQVKGSPLDRRCDVYAAGVVAWELAASHRLYPSADDASVLYRILEEPAPHLSTLRRDIPPALDQAVAKALAKMPSGRFPTAAAFARCLEAAGLEIASAEEVGIAVRRTAGERLTSRRAQVEETRRARQSSAAVSEAASISRDAPAVTAPPRNTGSIWRRGGRAPWLGLAVLVLVGVVAAVALGARFRSDAVPHAALSTAAAVSAPTALAAVPATSAPEVNATSTPAGPAAPGASSGAQSSPAQSSPAPKDTAGAQDPHTAGTAGARPTSTKGKPAKPALPLADSPYQPRQ